MNQLFEPTLSLNAIEVVFSRIESIIEQFDSMYPIENVDLKLESAFNQVRGIYLKKGPKLGSTELSNSDIDSYIGSTLEYRFHPENFEQIKKDVVVVPLANIDYSSSTDGVEYIDLAFRNYLHMYSSYNYMWKILDFLIKELRMTSPKFSRLINDDLYKVRSELYGKMKGTYVHLLSFATLSQNQNYIKIITDIVVSSLYISESEDEEKQFSLYQHIAFNKELNHGPNHHDHTDLFTAEIVKAKLAIMESK